jgi:cellulose synthase operon protein C
MAFRSPRYISALVAMSLLAGCATKGIDPGPSVGDVMKGRKAPDPDVLPIIKSEPIVSDPQQAIDNYRELLELESDRLTREEARRRLADLQVRVADAEGATEAAAESMTESIALYEALLKENPDSPDNDKIYYQLARAHQNLGNTPIAIDALAALAAKYPESTLLGDARFRRGELLFFESRYQEAEAEYAEVMAMGETTPFFDIAQYKLGWSRYRQSRYDAAVDVFIEILERELPPGEAYDIEEALAGLDSKKSDYTRDSIRVIGLAFTQLGGGDAANAYFAREGDPRFFPLLYAALGDQLLERQRYTDAAEASASFIERHRQHPLAPAFQERVIAAHEAGDFSDLVVREKQRYVETYDPAADYWAGRSPTPEVLTALRGHLGDLSAHFYASGQRPADEAAQPGANTAAFMTAAGYYRRIIEIYPRDENVAEMNFLLGEALFNGGEPLNAAREYERTAYDYPKHERSAEAGHAAVLAYQRNAETQTAAARPAALELAITGALRFAEAFPNHGEALRVTTRAAEDLYELKRYDEAIEVAQRVIDNPNEVDYRLMGSAWAIAADSYYALEQYPEAEKGFIESLKIMSDRAEERPETVEKLAASVYKQGEIARESGELRQAVFHFLRVKAVAPTATIAATADFDGASTLFELEDWVQTAQVIEAYRRDYPDSARIADADKMLALAYQRDNKPFEAAAVYGRVAGRSGEAPDVQQESAWLAATLFDESKRDPAAAGMAYERYVTAYPRPVNRAMVARNRLVEMASANNDPVARTRWLRAIVAADASAGAERTDETRLMAAESSLALGQSLARQTANMRITLPLNESLTARRQAMEETVAVLNQAASFGFAEVTTEATQQLGTVYLSFAAALNDSQRPGDLDALALEQYELLLEEQAFPFEERAIETFETNLKRIPQGIYDDAISNSYRELVKIAPAIYGRNERGISIYEPFQ